MKKYLLLTFAALAVAVVSCAQPGPDTVSGTIQGMGNDTLIVRYDVGALNAWIADTIAVRDGRFSFSPSHRDIFADLYFTSLSRHTYRFERSQPPGQTIRLYIATGDRIVIDAELSKEFLAYNVKGNAVSADMASVHNANREPLVEIGRIRQAITEYMANRPPGTGDEEWLELRASQDPYLEAIRQTKTQFIRDNPDSDLAAYYFSQYIVRSDFDKVYTGLTDRAKSGLFGAKAQETYESLLKLREARQNEAAVVAGTRAPVFTLTDIDGRRVSLDDFRGRYVALDFWGTWCGPCVSGMPDMKKYHERYVDRVVFIGIANSERDEEKWRSFLKDNGYDWIQLLESRTDKTHAEYGVTGFPTKFLLDPDHNIVEIFIGEREFFYEKLDELFGEK